MAQKDVLAIDFGTVNTYYCKCPGDQTTPVGIDFGRGTDGLATAILYRESKAPLIGRIALEEYGETRKADRKGYVLRAQFKPDIVNSAEARKAAKDFLTTVLEESARQHIHLEPTHREVVFGIPSEADDSYRKSLTQIANDAGYGNIRTVDEPKGAVLYHVFHKDIPARDALRGVLFVDFGGGTCDFAFLYRGKVQHSWGDFELGGRLFDDLFFQWFLDQNPEALSMLQKEGNEYFVHSFLCREMKEFFSQTMTRDRSENVSKAVRHYGRITDMTWQAFLDRAKVYEPSATFKEYLKDIGLSASRLVQSDSAMDLVAWFRESLRQGLHSKKIEQGDIHLVILAGGSSQWPFVADIVCEELKLDKSGIKRSDRPYVAISEGLAILPAVQKKLRETQKALGKGFPGFSKNKLVPFIEKRVKEVASEIAGGIVSGLFDKKLRPILMDFKSNGGSVASLEERLAAASVSFEPRIKEIVEEKMSVFVKGLPVGVIELVSRWFEQHGLALSDAGVAIKDYDLSKTSKTDVDFAGFYDGIINTVAAFAAGLIGGVVAMICGGGGMALIASGPLGWIIGLIIGGVAGILAVTYGAERAKEMAKEWDVPKWVTKRVLTDSKLAKVRTDLREDICSKVESGLSELHAELESQIEERVKKEIEALSEISRM